MRPGVFLDRDGILNELVLRGGLAVSPRKVEEFVLLAGVGPAVETLRGAGLCVVVVTNQPDVARGFTTLEELERMHERLLAAVPVDAIYICPHDDQDGCICRKPKPGLLLRASQELNIPLTGSYMIGDSWRDVAAGREACCTTVLIATSGCNGKDFGADFLVPDLMAAAKLIERRLNRHWDE